MYCDVPLLVGPVSCQEADHLYLLDRHGRLQIGGEDCQRLVLEVVEGCDAAQCLSLQLAFLVN